MSFVSYGFAVFVCVSLLCYYIVPKRFQWCVLLAASYYFYLCTGLEYIVYILATTVTSYAAARLLQHMTAEQKAYIKAHKEELSREEKKAYKASVKKKQKLVLAACLLFNFGILLFLKYGNWGIAYFNLFRLHAFGVTEFVPALNLLLPLGISFYTFQTMGYVIDIFYGKYDASSHFGKYALFASFFPQIIQGPISRYDQLSEFLFREHRFSLYHIKLGFLRIMWGLFKKLVIADRIAVFVRTVSDGYQDYTGIYIVIMVFCYAMQIYGDFSGGIDVALGVAEMFGIRMTENFRTPFFAKTISEYWTRWHITLGAWFRDYIFYPLSISRPFMNLGKWVRTHINQGLGKKVPIYGAMMVVWFTTGMWHGSENRYLVWGMLNCFFVILGTEFEPVSAWFMEKYHIRVNGFWWRAFRCIRTFWLMSFLRVFDVARDTSSAFATLKNVFVWKGFDLDTFLGLGLTLENWAVFLIACLILLAVELLQRRGSLRRRVLQKRGGIQWLITGALVLAVVIFGSYGFGYDANSFIYLQF